MDSVDGYIELRLILNEICECPTFMELGKNPKLSTKIKILFLLENRDLSPMDITYKLCIAKSNLANILKSMIEENLCVSYKNLNNSKNIFYRIDTAGLELLKSYKSEVQQNLKKMLPNYSNITNELNNFIHILKENIND